MRKPIQSLVLILSLTLTVLFGLILTKFMLISSERFKTLAREGQAIIAPKSNDIDTLLSALNLESGNQNYIPYNLYQTLNSQKEKTFEDGQHVYPQIQQVIPFLQFGMIKNQFHVIGTNYNFIERFNPHDSLTISKGHWPNHDDEMIIGSQIASQLSLQINDTIDVTIEQTSTVKKFTIVGLLAQRDLAWDKGAYTSITAGQSALSEAGLLSTSIWKSNILGHIIVYVAPEHYQTLKSLINDRTVSQLISIPETITKLENLTMSGTNITLILVLLVSTLGLCAIFGIVMSRSEQTINSLAILHLLGYSKFDIFKISFYENIIIWFVSCILALVLYAFTFMWIQNNIVFFADHNIILWSKQFASIFISLGVGISLFSVLPVWRLNKLGIHHILRSQ
jgi:ABC-type lipoprotein release transport system permease subunit